MARVSIYLPDELKSRMDEQPQDVNWSSIAQSAFEDEVKKRTWKTGADMETVVERLRESKREYEKREASFGYDEGVRWAKDLASYEQLIKLATDYNDFLNSRDFEEGQFAMCLDQFLGVVQPDSIFVEYRTFRDWPSDDYAVAFVKGATEVWNEVAGKL